jgi:hypothetical protein
MYLFDALGDLVSEEIRGWLDLAPRGVLRLAAAQLPSEVREGIYEGEWLPDLIYELRGAESRPITRVIRGTSFALGLLIAARRISRFRAPAPRLAVASGYSTLRFWWTYTTDRRLRRFWRSGEPESVEHMVAVFGEVLNVTPETLLSDRRFVDVLEFMTCGHFCTRAKPGTPQDLRAFKGIPPDKRELCECTQT